MHVGLIIASAPVQVAMYGCDAYAYGLLASGCCDVVAEADLMPYDFMALVPIVEGAGGTITDWNGDALRIQLDGRAQDMYDNLKMLTQARDFARARGSLHIPLSACWSRLGVGRASGTVRMNVFFDEFGFSYDDCFVNAYGFVCFLS